MATIYCSRRDGGLRSDGIFAVVRGGGFDSYAAYVRCAVRFSRNNWTDYSHAGMRMMLMDDAE